MSDESYLDSWQVSLHDKADSTRRLYRTHVADLSTHILRPVGLLCSYASFARYLRRAQRERS